MLNNWLQILREVVLVCLKHTAFNKSLVWINTILQNVQYRKNKNKAKVLQYFLEEFVHGIYYLKISTSIHRQINTSNFPKR